MPPQVKDRIEIIEPTYQVKARHQERNVVKQEEYYALSFAHAIEVADALSTCYRDIQIINEQTGEVIYNNYFSIELWETLHE